MSYDPANNAQLLKTLQDRCSFTFPRQGGAFRYVVVATKKLAGDHPQQALFTSAVTNSRVAIAWSAVYRVSRVSGYVLVAPVAHQAFAEAVALQSAVDTLNLVDVRLMQLGAATGALGVLPGQVVPAQEYKPGLQGDARWVNSPPYPRG